MNPPNHEPGAHQDADLSAALDAKLVRLGRELGAREAPHAVGLEAARARAQELHGVVCSAVRCFERAAAEAGSPHIQIEVGAPHLDDKHVRAVEFDVRRGRHRAILVVKARGDVTLVGPFHRGKTEGPCRSFPSGERQQIAVALGEFLERFCEQALSP